MSVRMRKLADRGGVIAEASAGTFSSVELLIRVPRQRGVEPAVWWVSWPDPFAISTVASPEQGWGPRRLSSLWGWAAVLLAILATLALLSTSPDPAASRLAPGSLAVTRPTEKFGPPGSPIHREGAEFLARNFLGWPTLPAGTRVKVLADDEPSDFNRGRIDDRDGNVDRRWVDVLVEDGEFVGARGRVHRNELRPVEK